MQLVFGIFSIRPYIIYTDTHTNAYLEYCVPIHTHTHIALRVIMYINTSCYVNLTGPNLILLVKVSFGGWTQKKCIYIYFFFGAGVNSTRQKKSEIQKKNRIENRTFGKRPTARADRDFFSFLPYRIETFFLGLFLIGKKNERVRDNVKMCVLQSPESNRDMW